MSKEKQSLKKCWLFVFDFTGRTENGVPRSRSSKAASFRYHLSRLTAIERLDQSTYIALSENAAKELEKLLLQYGASYRKFLAYIKELAKHAES